VRGNNDVPGEASVVVKRRSLFFPIILTVIAAFGVAMFIADSDAISRRIGPELFAMTYQFFLLIVLGSGVSVMFQTIAQGRELRERRRILQREIHLALVSGYNDAKRARRLLRARGRCDSDGSVDSHEYDTQLQALSDAQLAIELATRRIELNRNLFVKADELIKELNVVGRYLNCIVDEWEDTKPAVAVSTRICLADLPQLDTFLHSPDEAPRFRSGFKAPFDRALELIEDALRSDA
jgi:hypothetical protein